MPASMVLAKFSSSLRMTRVMYACFSRSSGYWHSFSCTTMSTT